MIYLSHKQLYIIVTDAAPNTQRPCGRGQNGQREDLGLFVARVHQAQEVEKGERGGHGQGACPALHDANARVVLSDLQ